MSLVIIVTLLLPAVHGTTIMDTIAAIVAEKTAHTVKVIVPVPNARPLIHLTILQLVFVLVIGTSIDIITRMCVIPVVVVVDAVFAAILTVFAYNAEHIGTIIATITAIAGHQAIHLVVNVIHALMDVLVAVVPLVTLVKAALHFIILIITNAIVRAVSIWVPIFTAIHAQAILILVQILLHMRKLATTPSRLLTMHVLAMIQNILVLRLLQALQLVSVFLIVVMISTIVVTMFVTIAHQMLIASIVNYLTVNHTVLNVTQHLPSS